MSINIETKKAYTEVVSILNSLSDKDYRKIPEELILTLEKNMDTEYMYNVDLSRPLADWKISVKAQTILAIIFRDYLATQKQKEKILNFEQTKLNEIEEAKREKYNPDNLFPKMENEENKQEQVQTQENLALVEYKENIFKKIFNKILSIFKNK